MVVKFIYIRKGFDKPKTSSRMPTTTTHNIVVEPNTSTIAISNFQDDENETNFPFASVSIYVCIRLVSFGLLYFAVTI